MRRIGVIRNPNSERNKAHRSTALSVGCRRAGVLFAELTDFAELPAIVAEFARGGVELIVVDGGDGTVQAVLTALLGTSSTDIPPRIAVIPSGMTNLIAADVGAGRPGWRSPPRFVQACATGRPLSLSSRPTIRMELLPSSIVPAGATAYGMFFGAAAVYQVAQFTLRHIHTAGFKHAAGVAAALAVATARMLSRSDEWTAGEPIAIALDDGEAEERRRFLMAATTLQRLALGMHPFWGDGPGPLRYLDIAAPPRRLSRALLPTLLGRPRPWMESGGYASGRAHRMRLTLGSPFMLDGRTFEPVHAQTVILSAGPKVEFARL